MFKDLRGFFKKVDQDAVLNIVPEDEKSITQKTTIVAVVNQKGGVGKTTTCINLAGGLAKKGFKVLIIDLDPQSHASLGLGLDVDNLAASVYDVLVRNVDLQNVIVSTYVEGLEIAPATSLLTGAQLEIADLLGREGLLRTNIYRMLSTKSRSYDYIFIDCSPSLNLLTINGLVAAQSVLIPIQAHYFSLEGMRELFSTIKIVKERINADLEVLGILPTIFDARTKMSREVLSQLKDYFHRKLLNTVIRMNIAVAEASAHGKLVLDYSPQSNGAQDYGALVNEIAALTRPELIEKAVLP